MKALIALPLAIGLALASPLSAYAASSGASGGASGSSGAAGGASGTGSPSPTANTGTNSGTERMQPGQTGIKNPAPSNMAQQPHPQGQSDGLSRNKSDCAKTGCVDNGN
jgi:hypothetical protein